MGWGDSEESPSAGHALLASAREPDVLEDGIATASLYHDGCSRYFVTRHSRWGGTKLKTHNPSKAEVVAWLRSRVLALKAADLGLQPSQRYPRVWAVVVEVDDGPGIRSLFYYADGAASVYRSCGEGRIDCGSDAMIATAAADLVRMAQSCVDLLQPVQLCQPPRPRSIGLHLLTYTGAVSIEVPATEPFESSLVLALIYHRACALGDLIDSRAAGRAIADEIELAASAWSGNNDVVAAPANASCHTTSTAGMRCVACGAEPAIQSRR
jgi:hypothetical protein